MKLLCYYGPEPWKSLRTANFPAVLKKLKTHVFNLAFTVEWLHRFYSFSVLCRDYHIIIILLLLSLYLFVCFLFSN